MKKIIAAALIAVLALSFAACGEAKVDDTVGTGKIEEVAGETIEDVSKLEPKANVNPSQLNIGQSNSEDHTGDAWYANGVRGENYIYFTPADNSSIGFAYVRVENGEAVSTVVCAMTEDMHLIDGEAEDGQSSIDIVFNDDFTAYDSKNSTWYVRGNPKTIEQLFVGMQLICQDNPNNMLILRADGTGTEVFDGEEDEIAWALDSASTLKYNDGEHEYSLEIVTDENNCFVSLNEQNFRIFVLESAATEPAAEAAEAPAEPAAQS